MKLGTAFKMARTRAGLKQAELAERLAVSANYLSMLENDRRDPSWSFICRACEEMKISIPALLMLAADANGILAPNPGHSAVQTELLAFVMSRQGAT
jgi:transcriptional regulator with XRE-family HTH domain